MASEGAIPMESQGATEAEQAAKMVKAKKLMLVLTIVGIIMFFAGLTSMHIVSRGGAAFWLNITIPVAFWWSTAIIVASSLTMWASVRAAKADNKQMINVFLGVSFLLSIGFVWSQFNGWGEMNDKGMHLRGDFLNSLKGEYGTDYYLTTQSGLMVEYRDGHYFDPTDPMGKTIIDEDIATFRNPSARNMILLTGLHALHVAGGMIWLLYLVVMGLVGKLGKHNVLKVSQGATYWHFVDVLWIYLLLFLYFIH